MKLKLCTIITIALSIVNPIIGQDNFAYSINNKEFVTKTDIGFEIINTEKDGNYIVFQEHECGSIDTLTIGEIKESKRNGNWLYYIEEDLFPCNFKPNLGRIETYDQGVLLSQRLLEMTDVEFFYNLNPENGTHLYEKIIYRNHGDNVMIDTMVREDVMLRREYNGNGDLILKEIWKDHKIEVIRYHDNGVKSTEFNILRGSENDGYNQVIDGKSKVWNEKGQLVEVKHYLKGVITKIEKIQQEKKKK